MADPQIACRLTALPALPSCLSPDFDCEGVYSEPYLHQSRVSCTPPAPPCAAVSGILDAYDLFHLGQGGLTEWKQEHAIDTAKAYHALQKSNFLGFQINFQSDYARRFGSYFDTHINNVGDAFIDGDFTMNSKFMERAVLDYYAALWHAKWPHCDTDPESYWGFFLSMGCTEGNLYSMWNAREYLVGKKILINSQAKALCRQAGGNILATTQHHTGKRLASCRRCTPKRSMNASTPIAFYSEDTHYSIMKALNMLNIRTFYTEGTEMYPGKCPITESGQWPAKVPSYDTGAINVDSLSVLAEFFASHGYPIIVCFNYGTTFRGAYDDVALACHKLKPILEKHKLLQREVQYREDDGTMKVDVRTGYWFHVDGALGAAYMPFIEMAYSAGLLEKMGPVFDFRLGMVHSIAMSGHKWIGAPLPCGIYMTRTKYRMLPLDIPYIGVPDTTFSGSRNGLAPMLLWDYIARHSYEDQMKEVLRLEELAAYVERRLRRLEEEARGIDLYVERSPLALTVRFRRPRQELCKKYSLSSEVLHGRPYSHVFVMGHVTRELVDAFIQDLASELGACSAPRLVVDEQPPAIGPNLQRRPPPSS